MSAVSNMATAYLTRGGYKGFEDLHKAIDLMEQVAKVRTRQTAPESWAITQMNLGLALSRLPTTDSNNFRQRAIDALRGAHEVFTERGEVSIASVTTILREIATTPLFYVSGSGLLGHTLRTAQRTPQKKFPLHPLQQRRDQRASPAAERS